MTQLGVNALQRATLISTGKPITEEGERRVSMPSNGPHSFLRRKKMEKYLVNASVNALQRATLISTLSNTNKVYTEEGVNALQRATLISTRMILPKETFIASVNALQRATLISTV